MGSPGFGRIFGFKSFLQIFNNGLIFVHLNRRQIKRSQNGSKIFTTRQRRTDI